MTKRIRYQGAILRDDHILLIQHREHATGRVYWIIPGGGRENGETEEECVVREMREETNLDVAIEKLLLDERPDRDEVDWLAKTYLCRIVSGEAKPGYEPETEASEHYGIVAVGWFDLRHPETWDALLLSDRITFSLMQRIQAVMGLQIEMG
jgi:ADP-ribose pyrophosphatase YjhB (NUDIX family)